MYKILIVINELFTNEKSNQGMSDAINEMITEAGTTINKKCVAQFDVELCDNFIIFSNNPFCLQLKDYDRRFTCINCRANLLEQEFYDKLWAYSKSNNYLEKICYYFRYRVINKKYIESNTINTEFKEMIIEASHTVDESFMELFNEISNTLNNMEIEIQDDILLMNYESYIFSFSIQYKNLFWLILDNNFIFSYERFCKNNTRKSISSKKLIGKLISIYPFIKCNERLSYRHKFLINIF